MPDGTTQCLRLRRHSHTAAKVLKSTIVDGHRGRRLDRLRWLRGGTLEPMEVIRVVEGDLHDCARLRRHHAAFKMGNNYTRPRRGRNRGGNPSKDGNGPEAYPLATRESSR